MSPPRADRRIGLPPRTVDGSRPLSRADGAPISPAPISPAPISPAPISPRLQVRAHAIRQVVLIDVAGELGDVVQELDQAIQLALADVPRAIVCDLSAVFEGAEMEAVEVLATVGRHVRDWPGVSVAVVCPDPWVREALAAHALGRHLIVAASKLPAMSRVLAKPVPVIEWRRLPPHPTSPRAARDFVSRVLLDWGLSRLVLSTSLVVRDLVTRSTMHASTDIDLSVAWHLGALRLTVRDNIPARPSPEYSEFELRGRGLSPVAGLSRAHGVLPTSEDGRVLWAVLNAARPRPNERRPSARHNVKARQS